jgi:hypothetical protein
MPPFSHSLSSLYVQLSGEIASHPGLQLEVHRQRPSQSDNLETFLSTANVEKDWFVAPFHLTGVCYERILSPRETSTPGATSSNGAKVFLGVGREPCFTG